MAIKVSGTSVINDSRQLQNIASLDSTTISTIGANISGGPPIVDWTSPQSTYTSSGTYTIPTSLGADDYITFYLVSGGGSSRRDGANPKGGYGGAALLLSAKKGTFPSTVTYVIGAGGVISGSGYSPQNGGVSSITISGKTFSVQGGRSNTDGATRTVGINHFANNGDVSMIDPWIGGGAFYINSDSYGPIRDSKFGGGAGGGRTQGQNLFTGGYSELAGNGGNGSLYGGTTAGQVPGGGGGATSIDSNSNGAAGNMRVYY